jgi:hypothetical protein
MYTEIVLSSKEVPKFIKEYTVDTLKRNIRKYRVIYTDVVRIGYPWHDSDNEYWVAFNLSTGERSEEVFNNGWCEVQINFPVKTGDVVIPEGFCMVCVGTYPKRCEIYAGPGAIKLLSNK